MYNSMKKNVFAFALALLTAASAWAYDFKSGDLYYNITDEANKTVEVTYEYQWFESNNYSSLPGAVSIPETVSYNGINYSVTSIGDGAFSECSALTQVTIPESVTSIGEEAFSRCSALTQVTIPESVTSIGDGAFQYCSALTQVTIGNSVESIGDWAFHDCSALTQITIPNSVTSIGSSAFEGTALYNNADNWTNNVLYIDNCLIEAKTELSGNYEITAGTRLIGGGAFSSCRALTQVTLPNSVTSIGSEAFADCYALTQVTIPESVTNIGNSAFSGCDALTQVTLPNSVTSIGDEAFDGCSKLTAVYYTGDVAGWCGITFSTYSSNPLYYAHNLYINNNLVTELVIPEGVTEMKPYTFLGCSTLTKVTWNARNCTVRPYSIGTWTLYGPFYENRSNIMEFTFGDQVEYIPAYLCYGMDKLTQVAIPDNVTSIGEGAFVYCSALTQVKIPESVTSIGDWAFKECSALTQITIPNSVTSIGEHAFRNCSALTQVTIPENVESIGDDAFKGCSQLSVYKNLSMAVATKNSYDSHFTLSYFTALDTLVCPAEELNVITDQELLSCSKQVKSIEVHSGTVTAAGFAYIKRQQNTLAILDMGTTENTGLDNLALYDCYALEKLTLPAGLERIGYKGIAECRALQTIAIPASVTEIDDSAFENCRSISSISFGQEGGQKSTRSTASSLKRIGNWAFYNCHQLQKLTIPEGVTEIGNAAFYGCTYLENLELPASVQTIGDNCFALCSKLQAITVQATTPPTIAAKTFYDVNRDIPVYVPADALEAYQNDTYWQEFNLHAMPTGLQTPSMPESIRIEGGMLHNPQQLPVSLYDMQGRMVYSGTAATVSQPAGVYVLRCAGASSKVLF